MSDDTAHFLCKNCGTIFTGVLGQREDRVCPQCNEFVVGASLRMLDYTSDNESHSGGDPVLLEPQPRVEKRRRKIKKRQDHSNNQSTHAERKMVLKTTDSLVGDPIRVHVRKGFRKVRYGRYFLFILLWVVIVGAVGWFFRNEQITSANSTLAAVERSAKEKDIMRRREYVFDNLQECQLVLFQFLDAPVSSRSNFVKEADRVIVAMNRYYRDIYEAIKPKGKLRFANANLLNIGEQVAIESLWLDDLDTPLEAVFFLENGKWKLDWEHFVRSGDQSLITFVNKPSGSRGIFRIAIRERLAETRRERNAYSFSISQPAILGSIKDSQERATSSLEMSSEPLKDYLKYLAKRETGETVFNSKIVARDSGSFNRVTVELEVTEGFGRRAKVKIVRFIRPHWLGSELFGYNLTAETPEMLEEASEEN